MAEHGWSEPLWLETTREDQGQGQAQAAVRAGVELVLACGGHGTVTAYGDLGWHRTPPRRITWGTGPLRASLPWCAINLGQALTVALTGRNRRLDAGLANGRLFFTMAGLGLDAKMLAGASEPVKKRLGWGAYVASALRHLGDRPMRVRLRTDSGRRCSAGPARSSSATSGPCRAGCRYCPTRDRRRPAGRGGAHRAAPGRLVVMVHVLRRRPDATSRVLRRTCTELCVDVEREHLWEIDGEVMGRTLELVVTISGGRCSSACLLSCPRSSASERWY